MHETRPYLVQFSFVYMTFTAVCYKNEVNLHIFALEKEFKATMCSVCGDVSSMCFMEFSLKYQKNGKKDMLLILYNGI